MLPRTTFFSFSLSPSLLFDVVPFRLQPDPYGSNPSALSTGLPSDTPSLHPPLPPRSVLNFLPSLFLVRSYRIQTTVSHRHFPPPEVHLLFSPLLFCRLTLHFEFFVVFFGHLLNTDARNFREGSWFSPQSCFALLRPLRPALRDPSNGRCPRCQAAPKPTLQMIF